MCEQKIYNISFELTMKSRCLKYLNTGVFEVCKLEKVRFPTLDRWGLLLWCSTDEIYHPNAVENEYRTLDRVAWIYRYNMEILE